MRNLKRALSLLLSSTMVLGMVVMGGSAAGYQDVDASNDNQEAIEVLQAVGIMSGVDDAGNFDPDGSITRNEMAVVMAHLLNLDYDYYRGVNTFSDVPDWAAPYVAACVAEGVTAGIGNGLYGGDQKITAAQAGLMVMKALGYFQNQEDFGDDWQVATIRQASYINLFDNVNSDAESALTRGQVAQLVLNGLKSDMVTFTGDKGVQIGDVTIGYRAEYTSRTGSSNKYNAIISGKNDIADQGQYYIQLGEELYDGDLKLNANASDDFARPAHNWRYDGKEIGTYAIEADASYTAKVEVQDIYKDLGLGSSIAKGDVTVYVDGEQDKDASVAITKTDDTKVGDSANGVLTEVYYDKDNDSVIIAQVNTYVGTVNRTVDAKGNQNAYVEINPEDVKPNGVNGIEKFETEQEFEDDAYILYTYSQTAEAVKSVAAAKLVSGEVTRAENSTTNLDEKKALTIDGTRYTASHNIAGEDIGDISVGENYDVYLDAYGYLIFVEEVDEIGDYALLVDTQDKGNFSSNRALLVFADGTEKVVDTTENYKNGSDKIANGTIVTYRVDEDGAYTLKAVSASKVYTTDTNNTVEFGEADYADGVTDFAMTNDKATITLTAGKDVTSNSSTVFVVYDDTNDEYTVYTGIKNAPTIKAESGKEVEAFAYCKSGKMATVMFIFVQDGSIIEDGTQNGLFLAKNSVSNLIHDKDGDYYEYQAVVNGEVQTVKVDESLGKNLNGLYKSYSTDKYGIITKVNTYATYTNGKSEEYLEGTGLDKVSADYTVTLDTKDKNETITVADEAKIFYVDEDGNVETSSYRSIAKDTNDKVYAVVKDYLVQTLVIEEVDDKDAETPVLSDDVEVKSVDVKSTGITIEYYVEDGTSHTFTPTEIGDLLTKDGWKASYDGSKWTVEKGYEKYTGLTVTETQLVKVSFKMAEGTSGWTISGAPDYVAKGSNSITLTVANANWSDSWSLTFTLNGKQVSTAADSGKTSKEITFSDTNIDADGTYTITVA